jgi:uncharacterized protein HemX
VCSFFSAKSTTSATVTLTTPVATTNSPEFTTKVSTVSSTTSRSNINGTGREEPENGLKLNFGGSAGAYVGAAIAVIIVVPGLTYAAYYFWYQRAASGSPLAAKRTTQASYNRAMKVEDDQEPVIGLDHHEMNDSYS